VCGLAWTSLGGATLTVDVNIMKGKGEFQITGNIGKVMEESAKAAISYIRANSEKLGIKDDFHSQKDIHIHIPEGAVPKDGPSAGITMTTAMVSALTGIPVRGDVAMTGEITIRGKVLAIGGLREKVLAAKSVGIKTVIVPDENRSDIEKLPEYAKENIEFVYADDISTVLETALIKEDGKTV
jgi:ATP-dependent Lon protease